VEYTLLENAGGRHRVGINEVPLEPPKAKGPVSSKHLYKIMQTSSEETSVTFNSGKKINKSRTKKSKPHIKAASRTINNKSSQRESRPKSSYAIKPRAADSIESTTIRPQTAGRKATPEQRMVQKQKIKIQSTRVRQNPRRKEESLQRWDIGSKLDYEERLTQGVQTVCRLNKIDWITDPMWIVKKNVLENDEKDRRLRRAKHSTACKNLWV